MASVYDVAKYILTLADEEVGDLISNLKLQKLVYYAQGFHLALFNEELFNERIEAWDHGPVVPPLYGEYKCYGAGAIPKSDDFDSLSLTDEQKELINEVYEVYGQFSAWKLRNMTHDETPWRDTPNSEIIEPSKMREYFLTQVN